MGNVLLPKFLLAIVLAFSISLTACDSDNGSNGDPNSDIPSDPEGTEAPAVSIGNLNTTIPNVQFNKTSGNSNRIQINMSGVKDPVTGNFVNLIANETIFITEDGVLQGVKVTKAGGSSGSSTLNQTFAELSADVVFTVDISGSMNQEADSIAFGIIDFVDFLDNSGLNLKVGIVGYYGNVRGALNLTSASELESFLTRPSISGTSRPQGFAGPDSAALAQAALGHATAVGSSRENGVVGITFADSLFSWRAGAQRVYVNFTDEPTQPDGEVWFSSQGLCARWTGKGTIHTVWSGGDTNRTWTPLSQENPYDLSACTGGTFDSIASDASGLDLTKLPVTGTLSESVLVEYITEAPNNTHTVKITIKNGTTSDGQKIFPGISYN